MIAAPQPPYLTPTSGRRLEPITATRMDIMNRAEFEADLLREGYELREGGMEPDVHRGAHTHDFDRVIHEGSE
jgi:hypothetical protein